ncbi:MAG TPA: hypothetical protein VHD91_01235 [Gaiellaceae bacterium]|nr:hypothetical protein [Gaiellaceae bacterium]
MQATHQEPDLTLPPDERIPGPVSRTVVEPHWLGVPVGALLLCAGFAALGAAIGLLASGHWPWGLVLVGVAALLLVGAAEAMRRRPDSPVVERSAVLVADGRSRAATSSQVLRARFEQLRERQRARSRLARIAREELPTFRDLGRAVWESDGEGEHQARARLSDLQEQRTRLEHELAARLEQLDERVRKARLPVDQTVMVAPSSTDSAPYPPPDEGDPPEPARIPEPYPPPDEATPPAPAPDPGQDEPA